MRDSDATAWGSPECTHRGCCRMECIFEEVGQVKQGRQQVIGY